MAILRPIRQRQFNKKVMLRKHHSPSHQHPRHRHELTHRVHDLIELTHRVHDLIRIQNVYVELTHAEIHDMPQVHRAILMLGDTQQPQDITVYILS